MKQWFNSAGMGNNRDMADREQREQESRESEDTKFHEAVETEREERERVAEQVDEPLPERPEDA